MLKNKVRFFIFMHAVFLCPWLDRGIECSLPKRGQKYYVNKLLWLWVGGNLMKESPLLWSCQTNLSNSSSISHPNLVGSHEIPLPSDPLYSSVQMGSDAENIGIIATFSFRTRIPLCRAFSKLNRNSMVNWIGYIRIISILLPKRQCEVSEGADYEVRGPGHPRWLWGLKAGCLWAILLLVKWV